MVSHVLYICTYDFMDDMELKELFQGVLKVTGWDGMGAIDTNKKDTINFCMWLFFLTTKAHVYFSFVYIAVLLLEISFHW